MTGLTVPAVNIREEADKYAVSLAVPGLGKDDCKIKVENGMLTISAEKKHEVNDKKDNYARYEYNFSSFSRSFALPRNADHDQIKASYNNGELVIEMPKKQEMLPASREITIQ
jgi:HSP20 family protein